MNTLLRQYHLRVLQLDDHATETDIRRSYRSLSKKYHPDINRDPTAAERFIAVKEAYEYLLKHDAVREAEHFQDSRDEARRQWREAMKRQARQAAYEREVKGRQKFSKWLNLQTRVLWAVIGFNVLISLDYLLPKSRVQPLEFRIYQNGSQDIFYTDTYTMSFSKEAFDTEESIEMLNILVSPVFKNYVRLEVTSNGQMIVHRPWPGPYTVGGILLLVIAGTALIYFRANMSMENKFTLGVFIMILSTVQVFVVMQ